MDAIWLIYSVSVTVVFVKSLHIDIKGPDNPDWKSEEILGKLLLDLPKNIEENARGTSGPFQIINKESNNETSTFVVGNENNKFYRVRIRKHSVPVDSGTDSESVDFETDNNTATDEIDGSSSADAMDSETDDLWNGEDNAQKKMLMRILTNAVVSHPYTRAMSGQDIVDLTQYSEENAKEIDKTKICDALHINYDLIWLLANKYLLLDINKRIDFVMLEVFVTVLFEHYKKGEYDVKDIIKRVRKIKQDGFKASGHLIFENENSDKSVTVDSSYDIESYDNNHMIYNSEGTEKDSKHVDESQSDTSEPGDNLKDQTYEDTYQLPSSHYRAVIEYHPHDAGNGIIAKTRQGNKIHGKVHFAKYYDNATQSESTTQKSISYNVGRHGNVSSTEEAFDVENDNSDSTETFELENVSDLGTSISIGSEEIPELIRVESSKIFVDDSEEMGNNRIFQNDLNNVLNIYQSDKEIRSQDVWSNISLPNNNEKQESYLRNDNEYDHLKLDMHKYIHQATSNEEIVPNNQMIGPKSFPALFAKASYSYPYVEELKSIVNTNPSFVIDDLTTQGVDKFDTLFTQSHELDTKDNSDITNDDESSTEYVNDQGKFNYFIRHIVNDNVPENSDSGNKIRNYIKNTPDRIDTIITTTANLLVQPTIINDYSYQDHKKTETSTDYHLFNDNNSMSNEDNKYNRHLDSGIMPIDYRLSEIGNHGHEKHNLKFKNGINSYKNPEKAKGELVQDVTNKGDDYLNYKTDTSSRLSNQKKYNNNSDNTEIIFEGDPDHYALNNINNDLNKNRDNYLRTFMPPSHLENPITTIPKTEEKRHQSIHHNIYNNDNDSDEGPARNVIRYDITNRPNNAYIINDGIKPVSGIGKTQEDIYVQPTNNAYTYKTQSKIEANSHESGINEPDDFKDANDDIIDPENKYYNRVSPRTYVIGSETNVKTSSDVTASREPSSDPGKYDYQSVEHIYESDPENEIYQPNQYSKTPYNLKSKTNHQTDTKYLLSALQKLQSDRFNIKRSMRNDPHISKAEPLLSFVENVLNYPEGTIKLKAPKIDPLNSLRTSNNVKYPGGYYFHYNEDNYNFEPAMTKPFVSSAENIVYYPESRIKSESPKIVQQDKSRTINFVNNQDGYDYYFNNGESIETEHNYILKPGMAHDSKNDQENNYFNSILLRSRGKELKDNIETDNFFKPLGNHIRGDKKYNIIHHIIYSDYPKSNYNRSKIHHYFTDNPHTVYDFISKLKSGTFGSPNIMLQEADSVLPYHPETKIEARAGQTNVHGSDDEYEINDGTTNQRNRYKTLNYLIDLLNDKNEDTLSPITTNDNSDPQIEQQRYFPKVVGVNSDLINHPQYAPISAKIVSRPGTHYLITEHVIPDTRSNEKDNVRSITESSDYTPNFTSRSRVLDETIKKLRKSDMATLLKYMVGQLMPFTEKELTKPELIDGTNRLQRNTVNE